MNDFFKSTKLQMVKNSFTIQQHRISNQSFQQGFSWLKKSRSFLTFVLIPWALISIYIGLIKTPEYESTASALIGHVANNTPKNKFMALFNNKRRVLQGDETTPLFLIQKYIYSNAMLFELQNSTDIKRHYQSKQVDPISRLKKKPNQKELLEYYLKKINVSNDAATGELIVSIKAFSPEKAQEYLSLIMQKATQFLSTTMNMGIAKQTQQVNNQLELSRKKLVQAEIAYELEKNKNKTQLVQSTRALEQEKLALRFAQAEYNASQKAYVLWHMSSIPMKPINTSLPSSPDYASYPNIPYDLISLLVVFSIIFLLGKMVLLMIQEHID